MRPSFTQMYCGHFPHVVDWMARRMGKKYLDYGNHKVLWFADAVGIRAAFVYNQWNQPNIFIHAAAREGVLWGHRDLMFHVFNYPFNAIGVGRITTTAHAEDKRHQKLLLHAGFKHEGTLRCAEPNGADTLVYGMLKTECVWLNYDERKAA